MDCDELRVVQLAIAIGVGKLEGLTLIRFLLQLNVERSKSARFAFGVGDWSVHELHTPVVLNT